MAAIHTDIIRIHRATGMPPGTMTPVRAHGANRQHNRSAESSVNGTIVLLANKAEPEEYERAADQPVGNSHNTA